MKFAYRPQSTQEIRPLVFLCLSLIALVIVMLDHTAHASPAPGDLFREQIWKGPWVNAGNWQRVTDPDARHAGAREFLPNPVNHVALDDLQGAVRAEMVIEQWGGHAGTSNKRFRLNGGDWMPIPEPAGIPGDAGLHQRPECYQYLAYPAVPLPLEQLIEGENSFEFSCDGQICFDFGWGQWGLYGIIFRIYYNDSRPHATGRIVAPQSGASFGDSLHVRLESADPTVRWVDFIGLYEDFDYEGNGIYRQWHYNFRYGVIKRHLGSAAEAPFAITWDAAWVPDQEEGVQIMARVLGQNGIYYMTEPVGDLRLVRRDRSVRLYQPFGVPGSWQTRAGKRHTCRIFIPHDLRRATSAKMLLATWSGTHADAIGVNDSTVVRRLGRDHDYSYDEVNVPLAYLRPGRNEFFTFSDTQHHGIEVLWPGIALKVQYEGMVETASLVEEARIYADDWGLEQSFPNPFNGETTIRFSLLAPAEIDLGIYNLVGQRLVTLERGVRGAGLYALRWDGRDESGEMLASGVYLYRLTVGTQEDTRKLLLVR